MSTAVAQQMTVDFVAWAEARTEKHWELFEGIPELQQPQNWGHARHVLQICKAIDAAITAQVMKPFVGMRGLVVKAGPRSAFEPDIVVFGGMADRDIIVPDPLIVIEVLSPSTERKDLTVKLKGCFEVPSIEHYLVANWEDRELIHYRREGRGLAKPEILRDGLLTLDPPGLALDVSKIFAAS